MVPARHTRVYARLPVLMGCGDEEQRFDLQLILARPKKYRSKTHRASKADHASSLLFLCRDQCTCITTSRTGVCCSQTACICTYAYVTTMMLVYAAYLERALEATSAMLAAS